MKEVSVSYYPYKIGDTLPMDEVIENVLNTSEYHRCDACKQYGELNLRLENPYMEVYFNICDDCIKCAYAIMQKRLS